MMIDTFIICMHKYSTVQKMATILEQNRYHTTNSQTDQHQWTWVSYMKSEQILFLAVYK